MKRFFLLIISNIFLFELGTAQAQNCANRTTGPKTYYVSLSGSDSNPGTQGQPFRTILKGMNLLCSSDTLYVRGGTYTDPIEDAPSLDSTGATSYSQAIKILAYPGETVTLKPSSGNFIFIFSRSKQSYVIVDGFIMDGSNIGIDCIKVTWSTPGNTAHNIWVRNSTIKNCPSMAILVTQEGVNSGGGASTFSNLDVYDNGFQCPTSSGMAYKFCHGIYASADNNVIEYSKFHGNSGWGIHVYSGSYAIKSNIVRYNLSYDNGTNAVKGDGLGHPGIGLYSGPNHQAYGNIVWGNTSGIVLRYGADNASVHDNIVYANKGPTADGVPIDNLGQGNSIFNNTILTDNVPNPIPNVPTTGRPVEAPLGLKVTGK